MLKNSYAHYYNKGYHGQNIFFSKPDYLMLLDLMGKNSERYQITIVAYCLIPNHYHFLLRQDGSDSSSLFIQTLFNTFVQKMNKKYNRQGTLFKGSVQSREIEKQDYLFHLCRYIHANPVKHKLVSDPIDWEYSNYREYLNIRKGRLYDNSFFNSTFSLPEEYKQCVNKYVYSLKNLNNKKQSKYNDIYFE